ncbi:MAG: Nif3-like dinuclear metal center hexameric protein [Thermodesulfobacteriota bacterium]
MVKLERMVGFLDEYLKTVEFKDHSWNGLQFEGAGAVGKVAFAVDAGVDAFREAAAAGAQMLVVHHGHFWRGTNPSYASWGKKRLDILMENSLSLYASHLPLDHHPVVGNNAQLLKLIGAKVTGEFGSYGGRSIGWRGRLSRPLTVDAIAGKLESELGASCRVLPFGPGKVSTVAALSGGGGYDIFFEALDSGVDLYVTGDSIEVYHTAKDAGLNVIFGGHHATETAGLKALRKVVEKRFRVETVFIDIPTGL